MAALRTLRALQAEQRAAEPAEQAVLARWGGWGAQGLWQVFDETGHPEHASRRDELHHLLDGTEYDAARRTTINAHYTDAAYVAAIWDHLAALGFDGGEVLEPGCGAGTFIGLAPASARITGVELDPTTAAIAAHLYPDATIRAESFADTRYPPGHFDAIVGNVPFADVTLRDPRYNLAGHSMHNHFILKSLQLTRPGGVVAVLTSHWTLDATNPAARRDMNNLADLIGAVRLPTGAHRRAAGTDALTDLLVFRRRDPDTPAADATWLDTVPVTLPGPHGPEQIRINTRLVTDPDRGVLTDAVLGVPTIAVGMHGVAGLTISPAQAVDTATALRGRLDVLAQQAITTGHGYQPRTTEARAAGRFTPALDGQLDGHLTRHDDATFTVVVDGVHTPLKVPRTQAAELTALLGLRDAAVALIGAEAASRDDTAELATQRDALAASWRAYTDQYGPINRFTLTVQHRTHKTTGEPVEVKVRRFPPAMALLKPDPYGPLVRALEVFDDTTQTAEPAGLLRTRQVQLRQPVTAADTPRDALAVSLDRTGGVDLTLIGQLLNVDPDTVARRLGDAIYPLPPAATDGASEAIGGPSETLEWVTRAEYLSGNVRAKLDTARAAAVDDPRWGRNVDALTAVLPADLGAGDVAARLGAVWIPPSDIQDFMRDVLGDRRVRVSCVADVWRIEQPDRWSIAATHDWGTERLPAPDLIARMIDQRSIIVRDTIERDDRKVEVINPTETEAAQEKARQLADRFSAWIWEDPDRMTRLLTDYNRRFNSTVLRDYSTEGEHLTLPGLAKNFTPGPHQRSAVARILNEPSVGLFHQVGAGKTAEMVIGAMELRRLGLVTKPAVVVPNHMLEQFSREWLQLYPQARVLAASADDLRADRRRGFVARAAANDWDAIIFTRTAFRNLTLQPAHRAEYATERLTQRRAELDAAKSSGTGNSRTLKAIEKALLREEEKLDAQLNARVDPGISFEESGIDYVIVDEIHEYKNLATASNIAGAAILGSDRATDLDAKLHYLRGRNGDRVMCGATATPIANSVTEMYVMQRYHAPQALAQAGIHSFDQWAATFGEVVTGVEMNVVGDKFRIKDRFAKFTNVPELVTMFHTYGDIKTAADLNLPVPDLTQPTGEPGITLLTVPKTVHLAAYIERLGARADQVAARGVDPADDNMLKISSDGRKAALDLRLVLNPALHPLLASEPTKIDAAADKIAAVWATHADHHYLDPDTGQPSPVPGALQLVFCDLSTPKKNNEWNVYTALRDTLHARGLPEGSVRFIHEASTDADKARLFAEARSGRIAVLIGSTQRMGVGTNVQTRAVHLLNMDAPWRPADVEQRHGRILRRGNQNPTVEITQMVTEGSFDAYMLQTLERKSRFINQIMNGHPGREMEDITGGDTLSFAEFKAVASGNPLLVEQMKAQHELTRYTRLHTAHERNQHSLAATITTTQHELDRLTTDLPHYQAAAARTQPTAGDHFTIELHGRRHSKRADAAAALEQWLQQPGRITPGGDRDHGIIGHLAGHTITLTQHRDTLTYHLADPNNPTRPLDRLTTTDPVHDARASKLGLIQRLENLAANIPNRIGEIQRSIDERTQRLHQAEAGIGARFPYTTELAEARRHYDHITAQLQPDQDTLDNRSASRASNLVHHQVEGGPSNHLAPPRREPEASARTR